MVAPLLLGILGAGLASQAAVHGYAIPKFNQRQGQRAQGILDDLPEDASIDDKRRALMGAGLLSVEDFGKLGFEDQASERDFLEQLRIAQTNNAAAMDRAILGEQGATERTNIVQQGQNDRQASDQTFRAEQAEIDRAAEADVINATNWREADDQFWAADSALETAVAPVNERINLRNQAIQIAEQLQQAMLTKGTHSPEVRALQFQLDELSEIDFYSWVAETYGDREPSPETLRQLREAYPTYTSTDIRRWPEVTEAYNSRNATDAQTVQDHIAKAQRTVDRLNEKFPGQGWAFENPNRFVVQPYGSGGTVSPNEVDPNTINR